MPLRGKSSLWLMPSRPWPCKRPDAARALNRPHSRSPMPPNPSLLRRRQLLPSEPSTGPVPDTTPAPKATPKAAPPHLDLANSNTHPGEWKKFERFIHSNPAATELTRAGASVPHISHCRLFTLRRDMSHPAHAVLAQVRRADTLVGLQQVPEGPRCLGYEIVGCGKAYGGKWLSVMFHRETGLGYGVFGSSFDCICLAN